RAPPPAPLEPVTAAVEALVAGRDVAPDVEAAARAEPGDDLARVRRDVDEIDLAVAVGVGRFPRAAALEATVAAGRVGADGEAPVAVRAPGEDLPRVGRDVNEIRLAVAVDVGGAEFAASLEAAVARVDVGADVEIPVARREPRDDLPRVAREVEEVGLAVAVRVAD